MNEMNNEQFENFLRTALKRSSGSDDAVERVFKRLIGPLPRQKQPLWRLPAVMLDSEFAPAWPRMAALGWRSALRFGIGIASLGPPSDRLDAPCFVGNRDIGSSVSEPDSLTGE